jgi:hypothetical protein
MKNDGLILGVLGATLLYLLGRTDQGQSIINDAEYAVMKLPSGVRGIRNNNPGNIRLSNTKWQGLAENQTDSEFLQFVDMEHGIRAMVMILRTYYTTRRLNTVSEIISRWAPPSENDTASYIAAVSASAGVLPDESLDMNDQSTIFALVRAIVDHENGRIAAALIPDSTVADGVALAFA